MKTPPASYYVMKAAKLEKGSGATGKESSVGKITKTQVREIATAKLKDMNAANVDTAMKSIMGTARSMGVEVVEG
jgi:large subunit ribosomal protein L11